MKYSFEWDDKKNVANFEKHGVWFEEAKTIWADRHADEVFDPDHSETEDRFIRIGVSSSQKTLLVVFCEREDGHVIRIVSARRATEKERKQYEEGI